MGQRPRYNVSWLCIHPQSQKDLLLGAQTTTYGNWHVGTPISEVGDGNLGAYSVSLNDIGL